MMRIRRLKKKLNTQIKITDETTIEKVLENWLKSLKVRSEYLSR